MLFFRRSRPASFEDLIRPHLTPLYQTAYRLCGNAADAEDLVQDLVVKLLPKVEELAGIEALGPWLKRVMYRLFVDRYRSRQRQLDVPLTVVGADLDPLAFMDQFIHDTPGPEAQAATAQLQQAMQQALASLPADQRMLLVMLDMEGCSQEDAAQVLDVPIGTVKSRLHRARALLKQRVQKNMEPFDAHQRVNGRGD